MPTHEISFTDLGIQDSVVEALRRVGITHPFPIQAMTLPVAMTGHDVIGQAKTGTGKTLGFAIPMLHQVIGPGEPGWDDVEPQGAPQGLVVVPTRELAIQVAADIEVAGALRAVRVLTVYGGRAYEPQIEALRRGVEVVVGTPGRLLDLAQQGHLRLGHARVVVLDEADEMLDLGFLPDVERLLGMTPAGRQTMLFSATMPGEVVTLGRRYMTQPTHIRAADPDDPGVTVRATAQFVYRAHSLDKAEVLARILQARGRGLTIIFTTTKRAAARVAEDLAERGFAAAPIHGDLGQGSREQALRAFRKGKIDVLVATDVAARGIDVEDVTHVINHSCPEDEKTYLHRIGRTGRAGNTGTAITLVDWDDLPRWALIDRALDLGIPEPEETYSTSPHLFSELDIPEGTTGMLPRQSRTRAGLAAEEVEDLGETGRARRRGAPAAGGRRSERTPARAAAPDGGEAEPRRERARRRRRTRGGRPIEDAGGAGSAAREQQPAAEDQGGRRRRRRPATGPDGAPEAPEAGDAPPRRRRRRRGQVIEAAAPPVEQPVP